MDFDPIPDNDDPTFVFTPLSRAIAAIGLTALALPIVYAVIWIAHNFALAILDPAIRLVTIPVLILSISSAVYKGLKIKGF
jgi:hypothetical protein